MSDSQFHTVFGSLTDFVKGDLEIINDNPKYYLLERFRCGREVQAV